MKIMPTLAATALLALLAAPAFAQPMPADSTPNAPVNPPATAMPADSTPPAATGAMAPSATDAAMPTSATVPAATSTQTVSNGPVPDTPEMRAKYKPLSHAGRHTKPAGN